MAGVSARLEVIRRVVLKVVFGSRVREESAGPLEVCVEEVGRDRASG